jgi:DNA-binding LacI/PurR family transcriptional regulator
MRNPIIVPRRRLLVDETAEVLRQGIRSGLWHKNLPGERPLSERFQVSRFTLRAALAHLAREGLIRIGHGRNPVIQRKPPSRPAHPRTRTVALLMPEPLDYVRPLIAFWISELYRLLHDIGYRFEIYEGAQYFGKRAFQILEKQASENPADCWVLAWANRKIQRWFQSRNLPAILFGSPFPEIDLPSYDYDLRAMVRHAVGIFLAKGHRRIAYLIWDKKYPGDLLSIEGFKDAFQHHGGAGTESVIRFHQNTVESICHEMRQLFRQVRRPTALLVSHPSAVLTAMGQLATMGLKIPKDVSLISLDSDCFLDHVVPQPDRYVCNARTMTRSFFKLLLRITEGKSLGKKHITIFPNLQKGQSVGPPPA